MSAVAPAPPRPEAASQTGSETFCWTRERYDRAVEAGVFGPDDRIELIEGRIVQKMPQNNPHRTSTLLTGDVLRHAFGEGSFVQEEKPVALSDQSEPEPDIAVVSGTIRDYAGGHPGPDAILLLVEVADTSLIRDRERKARVYAEAKIVEYWIVNLQDQAVEVHRDPAGGAYRTKATHERGGAVTPVRAPDASVAVADLLP